MMRIALAQINPTLADFEQNRNKIIAYCKEAVAKKASLVVFPECTLFGYHPFDLLERPGLVDRQMKEFAKIEKQLPEGLGVIFGLITKNPSKLGRPYYNSAVFLAKGKKAKYFHKTLLPTGDVFDEARFIEQGDVSKNFLSWKGRKFLITICEDIWAWPDTDGHSPYLENPLRKMKSGPLDMVINLSASPWYPGKIDLRRYVTRATAARFKCPLLYANLVGAQDEIIFDGRSFVMDPKGKVHFECLSFEEQLNVFDLDSLESWSASPEIEESEEIRRGLVLGIRDFCEKVGFQKIHLGLSGGIDSAVVACLAVDALGPGRVSAFGLPGPFSSAQSLQWAKQQAKNLGIEISELPITPAYETLTKQLRQAWGKDDLGVAGENIQSRLRGLLLMAHANNAGSLLLTTGNKSEYATGYATLYGDMCGGLAPIGDLTKEQVYALARAYNRDHEVIPNEVIERAPSAELRPDQKDQDSLPPYPQLDESVRRLVEQCAAPRSTTDRWLLPMIYRTEFKRWQAPPILKASAHSFGRGRRLPLAHRAKD